MSVLSDAVLDFIRERWGEIYLDMVNRIGSDMGPTEADFLGFFGDVEEIEGSNGMLRLFTPDKLVFLSRLKSVGDRDGIVRMLRSGGFPLLADQMR